MFSKYIPFDHAGLSDLGDVSDTGRHDSVAVICLAVLGEEADETLRKQVSYLNLDARKGHTEKAGIVWKDLVCSRDRLQKLETMFYN